MTSSIKKPQAWHSKSTFATDKCDSFFAQESNKNTNCVEMNETTECVTEERIFHVQIVTCHNFDVIVMTLWSPLGP